MQGLYVTALKGLIIVAACSGRVEDELTRRDGRRRDGRAGQTLLNRATWRAGRIQHRPEDRKGPVQRGVPGQGGAQPDHRGPQEGADLRDDGQQGQARLHEGDPTLAGRQL